MTINFLSKGRFTSSCTHESVITNEIAGLSREVCELCGRVSLGYVEDHYQPARPQGVETGTADMSGSAD